jgi:hypothetical protein
MEAFKDRLRQLKAGIVALFGKPAAKPAKTFALPVAQPRAFGISGLRHVGRLRPRLG